MTILSDERFNDGLSMAVKWVEDCLKDKDHSDFTPTMIVHAMPDDDDQIAVSIAVMPAFEMAKRHETLAMLGAQFAKDNVAVAAVYFVTEAWVSSQPAHEPRRYALPEQDPQRQEIIQAAGLTVDGRAAMAQVDVSRNKRNKMIAGESRLMPYGGDAKTENRICKAFYRGYVLGMMDTLAQGKRP